MFGCPPAFTLCQEEWRWLGRSEDLSYRSDSVPHHKPLSHQSPVASAWGSPAGLHGFCCPEILVTRTHGLVIVQLFPLQLPAASDGLRQALRWGERG